MRQTVVIADDHELMREGIQALLEREERFEIVAAVGDGETAIERIEELQPTIAVVDAVLPTISGVEVIGEGVSRSPETVYVLISMFDHVHLIYEAINAGAIACVSKNDTAADLLGAIEAAIDGKLFVSRSIESEWKQLCGDGSFSPLSKREREVMGEVVNGLSTKEIADKMSLSVRTVDHHRERLMRKVGARNAADVVRYAAQNGELR